MSVYVFTGPTLPPEEARPYLDAVYLPPVSQGDVYLVACKGAVAIGIIDGYFERVPSVWHKEIMWAMSRGIHVFGSASMGALRAVELEPFGMEGVGAIYEAYRAGELEDDDEVALVHGPADVGYRGGSQAMANIRFTLRRAEQCGVIATTTRRTLETIAKNLFYPDRSYERVLEIAASELPRSEVEALRAWLPTGHVNQKRDDAVAMLQMMRARLDGGLAPKRVTYVLENTRIWNRAKSIVGALSDENEEAGTILPTTLLEEMRLEGSFAPMLRAALARRLSMQVAEQLGLTVSGESLQETGDRWRDAHDLADLSAFHRWLEAEGLSLEEFSRLLRGEALRLLVERSMRLETGLHFTDELRLSGEHRRLLTKAETKQRVLEARGLQNPSLADVDKSWDELQRWYFEERLSRPVPRDVRRFIKESGFEDELDFRRAVLREYCYICLPD